MRTKSSWGAFIRSWAGASVAALYDDIYSLMPEDQPGSLPPQQYADVIAYILQLNGLPPGDVELATARDVLERGDHREQAVEVVPIPAWSLTLA